MKYWRAVCDESRKHGSEGGLWKSTVQTATRHIPTLLHDDAGGGAGLPAQPDARTLQDRVSVCRGTMEHTAVQLMSRKQRAAKLLTGDIGLTGLDAN
jgi:hypothetical protein